MTREQIIAHIQSVADEDLPVLRAIVLALTFSSETHDFAIQKAVELSEFMFNMCNLDGGRSLVRSIRARSILARKAAQFARSTCQIPEEQPND